MGEKEQKIKHEKEEEDRITQTHKARQSVQEDEITQGKITEEESERHYTHTQVRREDEDGRMKMSE